MRLQKERPDLHCAIAVVVPCYKVTLHICEVVAGIGPEVSAIFAIDDACPDQSGKYIEAHCRDPRLKVLYHEANRVVGGAVMTGYRAALAAGAGVGVEDGGGG